MQLTIEKSKTSSYGAFAACLILGLLILFFLAMPKYGDYKNAKNKAEGTQQTLDQIKQQQQTVNDLLAKLKAKSSDLQKVDLALPDTADIPDFYAYMESLAKSENLTINTIQAKDEADQPANAGSTGTNGGTAPVSAAAGMTGATAKTSTLPPTLGKIDMDLQVTGSLDNFISFLGKLQNSLRLIDVQSINIAAAEGKSDLTFITSLATYYQKSK